MTDCGNSHVEVHYLGTNIKATGTKSAGESTLGHSFIYN